jgi:hypothetical protein
MQATITYYLNEAGQKASLMTGGDGKQVQTITAEITNGHIDLFHISDGKLSASCSQGAEKSGAWGWKEHYFSAVPTVDEILAFLRVRITKRKEVEAAEAQAKLEKDEREKTEAATRRQAAITLLNEALVSGKVLQPSYPSYQFLDIGSPSSRLQSTDADCGEAVTHMLARATAERERIAGHEVRMKAIKAIGRATLRTATALPDGLYQFEVPTSIGEDWGKHVQAVDASAKEGYAFIGSWLKTGTNAILHAGDLVLVGGKVWTGSRKRGEWSYEKKLYIVTPSGLRFICENSAAKAKAIEYLAMPVDKRVSTITKKVLANCADHIASFEALDRTEYADEVSEIDERIAGWRALQTACEATEIPAAPEPEPEPEPAPKRAYRFDDEITDLASAADAIIAAGVKSLKRKYKDNDLVTLLLDQAKSKLTLAPSELAMSVATTDGGQSK